MKAEVFKLGDELARVQHSVVKVAVDRSQLGRSGLHTLGVHLLAVRVRVSCKGSRAVSKTFRSINHVI